MTARSPRRSRRQAIPAASLPRPVSGPEPAPASEAAGLSPAEARRSAPVRRALGNRAHHVTEDYSYVRHDLLFVGVIGVVVMAFIVAMSFVI
jgi:hypothetical protein